MNSNFYVYQNRSKHIKNLNKLSTSLSALMCLTVFNSFIFRIKELASPSNDESAADSSDLLLIQHIYLDLKRIKILIEGNYFLRITFFKVIL